MSKSGMFRDLRQYAVWKRAHRKDYLVDDRVQLATPCELTPGRRATYASPQAMAAGGAAHQAPVQAQPDYSLTLSDSFDTPEAAWGIVATEKSDFFEVTSHGFVAFQLKPKSPFVDFSSLFLPEPDQVAHYKRMVRSFYVIGHRVSSARIIHVDEAGNIIEVSHADQEVQRSPQHVEPSDRWGASSTSSIEGPFPDVPNEFSGWNVVTDDSAPVEERTAELNELLFLEPDTASRYIVESLCIGELSPRWRNTLVLAAETIQLGDDQLRHRLTKRLYEIASSLRHSTEAGIKPIVQSAIRCYSSMIPVSELNTLLPFLEPPNPVETRLVTLQCVVHVFESMPPESIAIHQRLANRIAELAEKFLDRDWLVAGEKAAIGQNATVALAALGDSRLSHCVEKIRQLEMTWLARQMERKLSTLLRNWSAVSDASKNPAVQLVNEQSSILRGEGVTC